MPGLRELQCRMRNALLDISCSELDGHVRDTSLSVSQRVGIYRNTVFTNLREALRTLFPVTEKLVGKNFFDYLADEFIRLYPSPAGDLNRFGAELGNFIADFAPAAGLPYLSDVADLEWQVHTVYHARNCKAMDFERLAAVDPVDYGQLHFHLNPAVALFASDYPVHRIWQVNQPDYHGEAQVDLNIGGVQLLVVRHDDGIELQVLSAGTWALLSAIANHADFARASAFALQAEPDMDLGKILSQLAATTTLVDFQLDNGNSFSYNSSNQEVSA